MSNYDGNMPRTREGNGGRTEYLSSNGDHAVWKTSSGQTIEEYESYTGSLITPDEEDINPNVSKGRSSSDIQTVKHKGPQYFYRKAYTNQKFLDFKEKSKEQLDVLQYFDECYYPHDGMSSGDSHYVWVSMYNVIRSVDGKGNPIDRGSTTATGEKIYYTPEILRKRNIDSKQLLCARYVSDKIPRIYIEKSAYEKNNLIVFYATKLDNRNSFDLDYTYFTDMATGKTYRISNKKVPKDVILKIADDGKSLIAISEKGDKTYPWEECVLEENVGLNV